MPIDFNADNIRCYRCGKTYTKRRGNFPASYGESHKGVGFLPICTECVNNIYSSYLSQTNDAKLAVRQVCRKLDIYWDERIYESVMKKASPSSVAIQYIIRTTNNVYAGKSYDDSLLADGTLWSFGQVPVISEKENEAVPVSDITDDEDSFEVTEDMKMFWGNGLSSEMYRDLEQRYAYWTSAYPSSEKLDIGTEALIRQICNLEIDINIGRSAGIDVSKSISTLNTLLGSANLKPVQREKSGENLNEIPFGVGIGWCEEYKPISEPDEEFRDVDGIRKYISVWLYGHLAKMLGKKNLYSQLYEDEIAKLRVERPQYVDEDDEEFINDILSGE